MLFLSDCKSLKALFVGPHYSATVYPIHYMSLHWTPL